LWDVLEEVVGQIHHSVVGEVEKANGERKNWDGSHILPMSRAVSAVVSTHALATRRGFFSGSHASVTGLLCGVEAIARFVVNVGHNLLATDDTDKSPAQN
jgi:hypothetical protein